MLTSTYSETESIIADGTHYLYTPHQVALTGLPRHDSLIKKRRALKNGPRRTLLIMPTWRRYLNGDKLGNGNELALKPDFASSDFAKAWQNLLDSPQLKYYAEKNDLQVVFFPHANVLPYIKQGDIRIPSYIEIGSCDKKSLQDYIGEAAICITDYSSASFDASIADVPVVYYQFDKERFLGGDHGAVPGYFDFERDGFGPVTYKIDQCLNALETIANDKFSMGNPYKERAEATFIMADGRCCERAYEAIEKL